MKRVLLLVALVACTREVPKPVENRAERMVAAARADSTETIKALLAEGADPDSLAPDGTRPLHEAARHGRVAAATLLLDAGADYSLLDAKEYRAFDYAVQDDHAAIAALVTRYAARDAGADAQGLAWFARVAADTGPPIVWHSVLDGELASLGVLYAALVGRSGVVSSMRRSSGTPNRTGYSALAVAARFGEERTVQFLLEGGANPTAEAQNPWRSTPLMEAARDGHVAIGRRLLRAGSQVNHTDKRGETALFWAVRAGELDYATILLSAGANPSLRNLAGETPLDIARSTRHDALTALLEQPSRRRGR